jgi:8-oxo-dGTP pyrophosphatase MutT (NUDIX family)
MLHGKAVMIVVLIRCTDRDQVFAILVQQPRVGSGQLMVEFPAGNMTDDSDDVRRVAARELNEEVGIECYPGELIPVSKLFFPKHPFVNIHPSGYDERTFAFAIAKRMTKAELDAYEGKHLGADQDEQITLHVVPFDDVWKWSYGPATLGVHLMVSDLIERRAIQVRTIECLDAGGSADGNGLARGFLMPSDDHQISGRRS